MALIYFALLFDLDTAQKSRRHHTQPLPLIFFSKSHVNLDAKRKHSSYERNKTLYIMLFCN